MSDSRTEVAVVTEAPGSLLSAIVQMAKDPQVDVAKLDALLAMQERLEARQAEAQFNMALHAAQSEMPRVKKLGTVSLGTGKGSYKFATWADMDTAVRPIMQAHGFALSFDSSAKEGGGAVVTGTLRHSAGHARSASIALALDSGAGRNNLQAMGSTLSYGKRYVAEMLFNIVREDEDDDGVRGGKVYVTVTEAEEVEALITKSRSDRTMFMRHFNIESITDLTKDEYTKAVNMLNAKLSKVAP